MELKYGHGIRDITTSRQQRGLKNIHTEYDPNKDITHLKVEKFIKKKSKNKIKGHSGTEYAMHKCHKGSCKSIKNKEGK
jgi:hypothetical protein